MTGDENSKGWSGRLPDTPAAGDTLREHARYMRNNPTPAEKRLWWVLQNNQRLGYKFRRQHIIDRFIVDFYCAEAHLVIEVDGSAHHFADEHDAARQESLESRGLTAIRLTNEMVFSHIDGVADEIDEYLDRLEGE